MATLHEGTTAGGSPVITAKNLKEYLEQIGWEGGGGTGGSSDKLTLNELTFEEYISGSGITNLDQLRFKDVGIYLTKGGITTTNANIYGTFTPNANMAKTYWDKTNVKLNPNLPTKSPMMDSGILFIINNSNLEVSNSLQLRFYHFGTELWFKMPQQSADGKFTSKAWSVSKELSLEYDNMAVATTQIDKLYTDKLDKSQNLKDLTNVTTARANLQIQLSSTLGTSTTIFASQKMVNDVNTKTVTNASDLKALEGKLGTTDGKVADLINNKVDKSSIVQVTGTSTTNIPSQKLFTDQINLRPLTTTMNTELGKKITGGSVVQGTGTSTTNVMSQDTVTKKLADKIEDKGTLGTIDLNTLDTASKCGFYDQTANANATVARNYPDGAQLAGTLIVTKAAGIVQIYITYAGGQKIWTRNYYSSSWSKWERKLQLGDITSLLGTSTEAIASQKLVTDVNDRVTSVETKANNALVKSQNLKDLTNVTTARTNLGLGNSAIRNMTSSEGTSTTSVASQALVNTVKTGLTAEIDKKITGGSVVQVTGTSTTNVPSQKIFTDEVNKRPLTTTMNTELAKKRDKTDGRFVNTDIYMRSSFPALRFENESIAVGTLGKEIMWEVNSAGNLIMATRKNYNDRTDQIIVNFANATAGNATVAYTKDVEATGNLKLAKSENLKDLANVTTARTNLGLGTSAIRNLTTVQGTSTTLVATQKLVNDIKVELNTAIGTKSDLTYVNTELGKKANNTVNIVAGNGLSGGGVISANRTITLGTPTEVSTTSTNSVATTSHTHALSSAVKASLTKADNSRPMNDYAFSNNITINNGDYSSVILRSGSKSDVKVERQGDGGLAFINRTQAGVNVQTITLPLNNKSGTIALTSDITSQATKLGGESSVQAGGFGIISGDAFMSAVGKVPANCVITRSNINGSGVVTVWYRTITRL